MKELGIYVHIPFCKRKCYYCDFYSICANTKVQEEYFDAINKEIDDLGKMTEDILVKTIYIGGGTPSFVDSYNIKDIINGIRKNFNIEKNAEITIEVNPGTITLQKMQDYLNVGINRISIGMQSSNDDTLKRIGRIHTWNDFLECYNLARKIGFRNINVDCMIGLPEQSISEVEDTINKVITLKPEHVSVYSLIVEEGTFIKELISKKAISLPDEYIERKMYWNTKKQLEKNGYIHYEISNFAKPGFESKHNLDCWNQKEYIGIGSGAHSYTDNCRFSNISNINEYIKNYKENRQENNIKIHEIQDKTSMAKEFILLNLRMIKGCNIKAFYEKFGYDIHKGFKDEFDKLLNEGLIIINQDNICLTEKGLDLANLVWEEFV